MIQEFPVKKDDEINRLCEKIRELIPDISEEG